MTRPAAFTSGPVDEWPNPMEKLSAEYETCEQMTGHLFVEVCNAGLHHLRRVCSPLLWYRTNQQLAVLCVSLFSIIGRPGEIECIELVERRMCSRLSTTIDATLHIHRMGANGAAKSFARRLLPSRLDAGWPRGRPAYQRSRRLEGASH